MVNVKKKTYSLIKYANGSLSFIQPSQGFFMSDLSFNTNFPRCFWPDDKTNMTVIMHFVQKLTIVFNVSKVKKPIYSKANGTYSQVIEIYYDMKLSLIKLPSGEEKYFNSYSFCTIGRNYNYLYNNSNLSKAGNLKIFGKKPKVRGVAKNPVDHPHGGRTKTNQPEVSPWGWIAKRNK